MQNRFVRHTAFLVAVVIAISLCLVDAGAQTRRKRRPRRAVRPVITNPAITPPAAGETTPDSGEKIISTADETRENQKKRLRRAERRASPIKAGTQMMRICSKPSTRFPIR